MILRARGESVDRKKRSELRKLITPEWIETRVVELKSADQLRLSDVFSDADVCRFCEELGCKWRERAFPPAVVLGLFVSQVLSRDNACSTTVQEFNAQRKAQGLGPVCEDASAYCKARAKLPLDLLNRLINEVAQISERKTCVEWKWQGRDVYLVDGCVLRAPDTSENRKVYPQPSSQKEGLGFPQVRMVVTTSLATGCIVHYSTGQVEGKGTGEVSLFRQKHGKFKVGDIVVADSNFESFHDAVLLKKRGVDLVCCMNASRDNPFDGPLETIEETYLELSKPKFDKKRFTAAEWQALPDSLTYRLIRYRIRGGASTVTVVTTLLDSQRYSAARIAELFGLRWDVELDIRNYKTTLRGSDLRCHTPHTVDREIAVKVLAYNLVRLLMSDAAAALIAIHPREISFSHARDAWRTFAVQRPTSDDLTWLILSTTTRFVRDRPNRTEPREIKRRDLTKYPKLREPRPSRQRASAADQPEKQGLSP